MDFVNRAVPGGGKHVLLEPHRGDFDIHGLLQRLPVHLSFTPEEERAGQEGLRAMGIPEGKPFICFYARDAGYHQGADPAKDFSHTEHRSSHVRNHVPAAGEMARRGYYAVRMGSVVSEPLTTTNPMVID